MRIKLTLHAKQKLQTKEAKMIKIDRKKILEVIKQPLVEDKALNPHRSISKLSENLSLAVIWKVENGIIRIITFYPAEKGRYESKVRQRG
ncbi:hypothetical protein HYW43_01155 [Candidatus Daviesbacteria bacterium]|nr:hypothetical protein [Candidatus Daviesbacteria bacterium]